MAEVQTDPLFEEQGTDVVVEVEGKDELQKPDTAAEVGRELQTHQLAQDLNASKIEMELQRGYRIVETPEEGEIWVHKPTVDINYQADLIYSQEVMKLMRTSELPTIDEQQDLIFERLGINRQTLEDEATALTEVGSELIIAKAEYANNPRRTSLVKKIQTLQEQYNEARKTLLTSQAAYHKFMSFTVESRADELRLIYKMSKCIKRPDGTQLWENVDALKNAKQSELVGRLIYEFATFNQGVDPRVLEDVPDLMNEIGDKLTKIPSETEKVED